MKRTHVKFITYHHKILVYYFACKTKYNHVYSNLIEVTHLANSLLMPIIDTDQWYGALNFCVKNTQVISADTCE
jgi:hypothetical protein